MSNKLSHLAENEVESLISRYYNNEKISNLITEYKLDIRPSQLIATFPPIMLDIKCEFCNVNLIEPRLSRSVSSWKRNYPKCHICGHSTQNSCNCLKCTAKKKYERDMIVKYKEDILQRSYESKIKNPVDVDLLSFQNRIFLATIILEGISEDFSHIKPIGTFTSEISATENGQRLIIDSLVDSSVLIVHPTSNVDSITVLDVDAGGFSYNPLTVRWAVNLFSNNRSYRELITSLLSPGEILIEDYESAFILWNMISRDDCIAYLCDSIYKLIGVDYQVGIKTISVINELLKTYSTGQIFGIFYKSINEALRYQAKNQVGRKQVANTIIGNALSFGDRARINNWTLMCYSRPKACPESALSKFFFERVLRIGYNGFSVAPYRLNNLGDL